MLNSLATALMKRAVDKAENLFITPHSPGGIVSIHDLEKILNALRDFPDCRIKLTGSLIMGMKDRERREELRRRLDLPRSDVVRFRVRPVQICAGGYICPNNQQDVYSLGLRLDRLYHGMELPFKMIISVAGCGRCCSEPKVRDVGIIAQKNGFSVYAGGAAGAKPLIGQFLADNLGPESVVDIVGNILRIYQERGRIGRRLGLLIEDMGLGNFKNAVLTTQKLKGGAR